MGISFDEAGGALAAGNFTEESLLEFLGTVSGKFEE